MVDLTTTNIWLAILAIVGLIEFVMICVAGFFAYRMYQKAMRTFESVERVHIAPLHARVDGILDEVQNITFKVKHAQESVTEAVKHMAGTRSAVAYAVRSRTWPIVGILQGLKSAATTVMKNGRKGHADSSHSSL